MPARILPFSSVSVGYSSAPGNGDKGKMVQTKRKLMEEASKQGEKFFNN